MNFPPQPPQFDRFKKPGFGGGAGGARSSLKKNIQDSLTSHKTGLPQQLLVLFVSRPQLSVGAELKKPKIKLPYTGLAAYVKEFAGEGDPDYNPPQPDRPPEPRLVRNRELAFQMRLDTETKTEK
jgi:U1 small nuclear ribonucleoprotein